MYLTIVPFLWSTNFVLGKVLVKEIPPLTLGAIRCSFAAFFLALLLKRYEKNYFITGRKNYILLFFMGITGIFFFNYLVYSGLKYTTSTNSGIVNAFFPAITIILSVIFIKERFHKRQVAGVMVSVFGVLIVTIQGSWGKLFALNFNIGDILVLFGVISWAVYSLLGKLAMKALSPLLVTTYSCLFGLVLFYPGMFMELKRDVNVTFSWMTIISICYIGFVMVAAQFLWNKGLKEVGPDKVAGFYNLMPIYTAILSIIFLGEQIHWYHVIGGVMVLTGVYFGTSGMSSEKQLIIKEMNS